MYEINESNIINGDYNHEFKILLASCLIKDARYTRVHIAYKRDEKSVKLYELYYKWWLLFGYYFFLWVNLALIFIEEPQSFTTVIPIIPYPLITIINYLCLFYFLFRWFHQLKCSNKFLFWRNIYNIITIIILLISFINVTITLILKLNNFSITRFQWARILRPFLCATFPENYKIRSALNNIRGTLFDISIVFFMFLFMLGFFSLIALQFFANANFFYPNGDLYFRNYANSFFDLYVLVTTSNSPDVILPAYKHLRSYIFLYLGVTIVCNWMFMGIVVASVYNAYKLHLGVYVIETVKMKKNCLSEAFDLLKNPENNEIELMTFVNIMKIVDKNSSEAKSILLFKLLDLNKSNTLSIGQFTKLTEFMHINFQEIPMTITYFRKHIPALYWLYMSKVNQVIKPIIRSTYVKLFFEFLVLMNALFMIFFNGTKYEMMFEWIFTMIFVCELLLRMFASGLNLYFKENWNIFDFIIIMAAVISLIIQEIMSFFLKTFSNTYLRFLLALRILRLLKVISVIHAFRLIMHCIIILTPSLFAYAAVQLSIYYFYVCIGMQIFGNRYFPPVDSNYQINSTETIDCGNEKLRNSDFVKLQYCMLNFNSAADGFLLMTILTVSNNWHILLTGATLTTHEIAKLFFLTIHWFCVLLVMNIVLAFIIDAYLMEVEAEKGRFEEIIEKRLIELELSANEELKKRNLEGFGTENFDLSRKMLRNAFPNGAEIGPIAFRLQKSGPKNMDTLLQRMFEEDIEKLQEEFTKHSILLSSNTHLTELQEEPNKLLNENTFIFPVSKKDETLYA